MAHWFSSNGQIAALRTMSNDAYLADQQRLWLSATELRDIPSYCAYEEPTSLGDLGRAGPTGMCNNPFAHPVYALP